MNYNQTRAMQLRDQALSLLRQAQAIDGLKPHIISVNRLCGPEVQMGWASKRPVRAQVSKAFVPPPGRFEFVRAQEVSLDDVTGLSECSRLQDVNPEAWLRLLLDQLDELGFDNPNEAINPADLVEFLADNWPGIRRAAEARGTQFRAISEFHRALVELGFDVVERISATDTVDVVCAHIPALRAAAIGDQATISKPLLTAPYPMTLGYVAIGAARELDSRGGLTSEQADQHSGEIGFMNDVVRADWALMLDQGAIDREIDGIVFEYEVAEPFGRRIAAAELDGQPYDAVAIATELLDGAKKT